MIRGPCDGRKKKENDDDVNEVKFSRNKFELN